MTVIIIVVLLAIFFLYKTLSYHMQKELVCTRCHNIGLPDNKTGGSFVIEIILWLCLIIPGIIYSIWRLSSKYDACSSCGSTALVPLDSPRGKKIVAALKAGNHAQVEHANQNRDELQNYYDQLQR